METLAVRNRQARTAAGPRKQGGDLFGAQEAGHAEFAVAEPMPPDRGFAVPPAHGNGVGVAGQPLVGVARCGRVRLGLRSGYAVFLCGDLHRRVVRCRLAG